MTVQFDPKLFLATNDEFDNIKTHALIPPDVLTKGKP